MIAEPTLLPKLEPMKRSLMSMASISVHRVARLVPPANSPATSIAKRVVLRYETPAWLSSKTRGARFGV